jgi:hypothetical protein
MAWIHGNMVWLETGRVAVIGAPAGFAGGELFDLGFFEFDVLAHHRVVFVQLELGGLGAGVLFRDVEIPGVGGGNQLDLDDVRFGHEGNSSGAPYEAITAVSSSGSAAKG